MAIGFILILSYHARLMIAHRNDCNEWQQRTGNAIYWLDGECYWVVAGKLEPAPYLAPELSHARPVDLSGMRSVRYPYGKCTPTTYDSSGKAWSGICEATDADPESYLFTVAPLIGE